MDPQLRVQYLTGRLDNYYSIMRTTVFALAGLAAIISFAPGKAGMMLAALVVATTAFGILAGSASLNDIDCLRQDIDETTAQTNYGRSAMSRNVGALKLASNLLIGLAGLAEVMTIFF
ncbi:hypothetical protein [Primorskyibacter sp. S87]|uniref:hypothetical protein n=1 Tax=Primorskyibacter sp. S87 TaxID=3415126 RepID=UPI003C7DB700